MVTAAVFLLLGPLQLYSASAHICSSQHFQKLKKDSAKNGSPSTPIATPTKAATVPKAPKTPKSSSKSTKSANAAGAKRKRAGSVDASNQDGDEDDATLIGDDNGDDVPKTIKTDPGLSQAAIIKSEEVLADGSLDLTQDS